MPRASRPSNVLSLAGAGLLMGAIVYVALWQLTTEEGWQAVWESRELFWKGLRGTLKLAGAALVVSLILGLALALGRRSRFVLVRSLSAVHVEIIRGTPLLAQILILYYGVFHLVNLEDRWVASVLILSNFAAAYISEIVRAGIEGIGTSQLESARAIGLTNSQTYRYVVFPQALRQILPPLAGQSASLIKDSSLLSIIGLEELTLNAQSVASNTFTSLESYFPLAVAYFAMTLPISLWCRWLEHRARFDT
ncbi:MAG TPA: amino acid ABC transporter permease [Chthoniobacteraceae bacterium]|nr:amino acid ABC transporter permease [Chthoniobacteraceae bacterium]